MEGGYVEEKKNPKSMEEITSLCKRRGFIFQGSDIYGGLQGIYDYGPLGVELKNGLKAAWWQEIVYAREDVEGLDSAIILHALALKHSGHEATFSDPMVDCKECKARMRFDHLEEDKCEKCGSKNLTEPRAFNLMLKTHLGPVEEAASKAYLRPETAQGIFLNFKNVLNSTNRHLPFGIAQIGKAFRNEVTPKNFLFRVREFEQMELEFFVEPGEDEEWFNYWVKERHAWWMKQGLSTENVRLQEQKKEELAHYAKATIDILYHFPFGWQEIEGVANRIDYDLASHSKELGDVPCKATIESNKDSTEFLTMPAEANKGVRVPFVIEPSAGLDRAVLALLCEAYHKEDLGEGKQRVVLRLKPHLAPIKVAIIPLAKNNPHLVAKTREIYALIKSWGLGKVKLEEIGNVGKAYRRHDEIGTPLCITVDFETLEDPQSSVTVRDRDSMQQERVALEQLDGYIHAFFAKKRALFLKP